MVDDRVSEPGPYYIKTTPVIGDIEDYVIREFERVRGKRPLRVEVVLAPHEVGVIIYLDEVTDEDRIFIEKLEHRLSETGEPSIVVGTAGSGIGAR